ncbi:phosphatidate cytidylyltransferase [Coxiella endosymbiont of Amblyomma americanum]|uniref:phosphatidate cytidylyltransferase n=1 Tax=Coxiella endosymbiont of Amblyomma americanum TaxID=325775 RepID=UPI0005801E31|nr:phosphatidate cytidylyltransferase [Coxiella endosymbiont of Amblyomma americanum]AJC50303.1 phosphatidate cytidylyltransferase [Coxiella endosymbiont of Amblyomma americanum]AUJ58654.1 phosphatidate cytidylyltransferase [Coxiella-like endosymbiont of Amblyomma americanum]
MFFRCRVPTSLTLITFLFLVIQYLSMPWFGYLIGIVVALAAWEWSILSGMKNFYFRVFYVLSILLALIGIYYLPIFWISTISFFVWLWAAAAVICYAKRINPLGFQYSIIKIIMGFIVLTSFWISGIALRSTNGSHWLLFGLVLIFSTDIGAYAVGRWCGRRILIARVSPNKTWEGLFGGVLLTSAITVITFYIFHLFFLRLILASFLSLVVAIFAIIGDLFESMLKRQAEVKDSGRLFPGHGGMLDRIDSTLAALPVFLLYSIYVSSLIT